MTKHKGKTGLIDVKELLQRDEDFLRAALQALAQAALEAEMTETIGAAKGERTGSPAGLPQRLLQPRADHPGRNPRTAGPAGSRRTVFDRTVPALPALGEGAGRHSGRDVRAGGVDAEGQGGD